MNKTCLISWITSTTIFLSLIILGLGAAAINREEKNTKTNKNSLNNKLELIRPSGDNLTFIGTTSGEKFNVWGLNYDHDENGRLLEEYWFDEWDKVISDFQEMKEMGANVIRIHLQFDSFIKSPGKTNRKMLKQLHKLINLAEKLELYLDITGLGCYHKKNVPEWYDAMNEAERWKAQEFFWTTIAKACSGSPAIFCYNLMNEPILPGNKQSTEWVSGELGGKYYTQMISLNLTGRTREQVAKAWVDTLVQAIRKHDKTHMVTVGVIPWAHTFPNAKPMFYSPEVSENLDFVSVHFYPQKDANEKALKALNVYNIDKPLVIEEIFPLYCDVKQLDQFIEESRSIASGWVGFYWGRSTYNNQNNLTDIDILINEWLKYFASKSSSMNLIFKKSLSIEKIVLSKE